MRRKITKEEFITKAVTQHGSKYNYDYVEFKKGTNKVVIICNTCHQAFEQDIYLHMLGNNCPFCAQHLRGLCHKKTADDFILEAQKIHNNTYGYSKTFYKGYYVPVVITCKIHGDFLQKPSCHLMGSGCQKCYQEKNTYNQDLFIEKAQRVHQHIYDYSKVVYKGAHKSVEIVCKKHGSFWQVATTHLSGCGCPHCNASKGELRIERFLKRKKLFYSKQYRFKGCKSRYTLPFDFAIFENEEKTKLKCLIEFDGLHHFEAFDKFKMSSLDLKKVQERDKIKDNFCLENSIILIRIKYDDKVEQVLDFKLSKI